MQRDGRQRIKLPDGVPVKDSATENNFELDVNHKKRQQLITFGHSQWGFKNWNWSVTKQELDFVDYVNGKYTAGVVAFVSVTVTTLGLHREDIGYATTVSLQKGYAVYNARKVSVTNALRETLLGFGGDIAIRLMEQIETFKIESEKKSGDVVNEIIDCNSTDSFVNNTLYKPGQSPRKDSIDSSTSTENKAIRLPQRYNNHQHPLKNVVEKPHNILPSNNMHVAPQPINSIQSMDTSNISANQTMSGFAGNHNTKIVHSVSPRVPPPAAIASGNARPNPTLITAPNHPSNVLQPESNVSGADKIDDEMRAERIRRQKQKMEEFKSKQMQKSVNAPLEDNEPTEEEKADSILIFSSQDSENELSDTLISFQLTYELKRANSKEISDMKKMRL